MTRAQGESHVAEGHANYNSACEFCVGTRGKPDRHRRAGPERPGNDDDDGEDVPSVSFDFCFLSQNEQVKSNTVLVAKDNKNKCIMATTCPSKSTTDAMHSTGVCKRLAAFLDFVGYPRVALRSDQERSTLALQERVKALRRQETVLTRSKKKDSK